MKKYLMVEIAPITPELLERFKESGEWIISNYNERIAFKDGEWRNEDYFVYETPTHYLPDGLPSPDDAVEVFEEVVRMHQSEEGDAFKAVFADQFERHSKVGVFKL